MAGKRQAVILSRTLLALSVALAGAAPSYATLRVPQPAIDDAALSSLLLKVQSVDPGGGDGGGGTDGGNGGNNGGRDGGRVDTNRPDRPVVNERLNTDRIVQDLLSIRKECGRYDAVYRIDCLRQGIDMTVARMGDQPENRDAKRILRRASRQLAALVSTYADDNAAELEVSPRINPRFKKARTYHAIKKSALPKAMAKANAIVTEAATELLRSGENSERRYAHYQQISAAVDSTKTLLRSG